MYFLSSIFLSYVNIFKKTLAKKNITDFNPTATRFSKVFDKSLFVGKLTSLLV